jgi:hypothetical protein
MAKTLVLAAPAGEVPAMVVSLAGTFIVSSSAITVSVPTSSTAQVDTTAHGRMVRALIEAGWLLTSH